MRMGCPALLYSSAFDSAGQRMVTVGYLLAVGIRLAIEFEIGRSQAAVGRRSSQVSVSVLQL